jgi:hypothetical protein
MINNRVVMIILIGICCFQTGQAQSLAIRIGGNLSSAIVKNDDPDPNLPTPSSNLGPAVGLSYTHTLSDQVSISSGVNFSVKGFNVLSSATILNEDVFIDGRLNLHYIEIPTLFIYKIELHKMSLVLLGGPYVAFGAGGQGTTTIKFRTRTVNETRDVPWGNEDGDLKRVDFGGQIGIGAQFYKLRISCIYGLGLPNVFANRAENQVFRNSVLSLVVSYTLFDF